MDRASRQFVFQHVYDMAALVEACADNPESLIELNWKVLDLCTFPKISILHWYIYRMISVEEHHHFRKNADLYEAEEIARLEAQLAAYAIPFKPYSEFVSPIPPEQAASRTEDPFYQWFLSQESSFELLWGRLTDEAFHLLFGNRAFLLKLNRAIAAHLRRKPSLVPKDHRSTAGTIKRRPIPKWVRDAVFYRDYGRCVLCHIDLSGLLATDRVDHFDHIVPLAEWGINDAINIQLMCGKCNLTKGAGEPITGDRYVAWWRY